MRVLLTGATGFLGWHTRLRLCALADHTVVPVTRRNWSELPNLMRQADAVIHIAGVNRSNRPEDVRQDNIALATDVAKAMMTRPGLRVVYANSTQAGNNTPYGEGKAEAGAALMHAADATGGTSVDVRLPNIFGEHGRPRYNSFVATFVRAALDGEVPAIVDNQVPLLHAQDAADALIRGLTTEASQLHPDAEPREVREVWDTLCEFSESYLAAGAFPDLGTKFRVDLFNTYRAALFPRAYPILLHPHSDARGTFVETVRATGGQGQSSISTTRPGVTRGEHFHLSKIERFVVFQGQATIALRRMFTSQVLEFKVSGDRPTAVDMPVGWAHNITNTGADTLVTQFWSHDLFDPAAPDTYPASVFPITEEMIT